MREEIREEQRMPSEIERQSLANLSVIEHKKIQITDRDVEVLRFVNDFGFCEALQIKKRFTLKRTRVYQLMNRLVMGGLIKHRRLFYGRAGVYTVTPDGARYTRLAGLSNIPVSHYKHHLLVIDLYLALRERYPDAIWISERYLIRAKYQESLHQKRYRREHLADGHLILSEGKRIAIEVELTIKGKARLERILTNYSLQLAIKEIWYFCHQRTIPQLRLLTADRPFVKMYNIEEYIYAATQ